MYVNGPSTLIEFKQECLSVEDVPSMMTETCTIGVINQAQIQIQIPDSISAAIH